MDELKIPYAPYDDICMIYGRLVEKGNGLSGYLLALACLTVQQDDHDTRYDDEVERRKER